MKVSVLVDIYAVIPISFLCFAMQQWAVVSLARSSLAGRGSVKLHCVVQPAAFDDVLLCNLKWC